MPGNSGRSVLSKSMYNLCYRWVKKEMMNEAERLSLYTRCTGSREADGSCITTYFWWQERRWVYNYVPLTSFTPFLSQIEIGCSTLHMRSHLWPPPPPPLFSLTCGHIALVSHWIISTRHCRHRKWRTSVQSFMSSWRRLAVLTSSKSCCWLIVYSQEPILRATQYLPELVQLQKQMFEFSHRRLDRKEAARVTVREYISSLNSG